MHFFTADLHLGHRAIIDHCYRPFPSVEEMDAVLLDNINQRVTKSDMLYILGDFSLGNKDVVKQQLDRLRCKSVYLIRGNHDRLSPAQYDAAGFFYKGDMLDLKVQDQHITLCHYAMRRWNKSHHGAWHLYGHSHGHLPDDPLSFSFDIGVDCHNFFPLSFDEVRDKMLAKPIAVAAPNHTQGNSSIQSTNPL